MKNPSRFILSLSLAFFFFILSCEQPTSGLGTAVDLDAPDLTITSHQNLAYVPRSFVLSGECSDNRGVDRVVVSDVDSGEVYGNAGIHSDHWEIELALAEGERTLRVTAYDDRDNSSYNSVRQITLLVDATLPFVESVEIERQGGIYAYLQDRNELSALEENLFANIDSFQNGSFLIRADIEDDFPLSSVVLNLFDEDGDRILSLEPESSGNLYMPDWIITQDILTTENSLYSSGRHYFRATVTANDAGGNRNEENTDQFLWFCWYPETDLPHILISLENNNAISVPTDSSIPIEFFDDDNLDKVYAALLTPSEWSAVPGSSNQDKLNSLTDDATLLSTVMGSDLLGSDQRSYVYSLDAGTTATDYYLAVLAKDSKDDGSAAAWSSRVIPTLVTDENAPLLVVESPTENTFPGLTSGQFFSLEGYSLDNRDIASIHIAWIPDGIPGGALNSVQDALAAISASAVSPGNNEVLSSGIKIWNLAPDASIDQSINGKIFKKQNYSIDMDILSDFVYQGNLENGNKLFVIRVEDRDGNVITRNYQLFGSHNGPDIDLNYPSTDLKVHNINDTLTLSFDASHANGLSISDVYCNEVTDPANPVFLPLAQAGSTYSVSLSGLTTGRRTFEFGAEDVLGNTTLKRRTVILTDLPVLEDITSGMLDGIFKAGDELHFQAVFSNAVRVVESGANSPRLRLRYSAGDSVDKFADYVSGSGTNTLLFSFTVPQGAESAELMTPGAPVDLNGAAIETTEGSGGNALIAGIDGQVELDTAHSLQGNKDMAIDGISPVINSFTDLDADYKEGDTFTITLNLSENILVSGNPQLRMLDDDGSVLFCDFPRLSADELQFSHTVAAGTTASPVRIELGACFSGSDTDLITDLAGNPLVLSGSGNTDTRIVLDTTAPAAPVMSLASGTFNSEQSLTLTGLETGADVFYSVNGGIAWTSYNSGVALGDGEYLITAYQQDAAGNRSPQTAIVYVTINSSFPTVTGLSCEQPDGIYASGETLTFRLSFDDTVLTTGPGASITLGGSETVPVRENPSGSSSLYFDWTVPDSLNLDPVTVTNIDLRNVEDLFGNSPAPIAADLNRPDLTVDSVAPEIQSRIPVNNGVLALDSSDNSVIVLTFNEPVFIDSGQLHIRPHGDWLIPPVLTAEEFSQVYNSLALTDTQRMTLMETDGQGRPLLDDRTMQPIGPYKKTTHGLKLDDGIWVPDTSPKYVLDFEHDLDDDELRTVFTAASYYQQTVDISSFRVEGSGTQTIKITLPEPLPDGREWELMLDSGALLDAAGNSLAEIMEGDYIFWSDQVATPVIRVDRYSHGWGAQEPNALGEIEFEIGTRPDTSTAPTGYARFRIDCETPGATVLYGVMNHSTVTVDFATALTDSGDPAEAELTGMTLNQSYSEGSYVAVGDGSILTARKDYIVARAIRTGLTSSDRGNEGVFKTLLYYTDPYPAGGEYNYSLRIEGSTIMNCLPTVSGFPLRDADPDTRYGRYAYHYDNGRDDWIWISYDFVSSWFAQSVLLDYQNNYNECRYGECTYKNEQGYWR